eukprot:7919312-Alexandrium_andersonii.AAC.1
MSGHAVAARMQPRGRPRGTRELRASDSLSNARQRHAAGALETLRCYAATGAAEESTGTANKRLCIKRASVLRGRGPGEPESAQMRLRGCAHGGTAGGMGGACGDSWG